MHSPLDARRKGIETVYQDLALAPDLTVAENLFIGRELKRPGLLRPLGVLDRREMNAHAGERARPAEDPHRLGHRPCRRPLGRAAAGDRGRPRGCLGPRA